MMNVFTKIKEFFSSWLGCAIGWNVMSNAPDPDAGLTPPEVDYEAVRKREEELHKLAFSRDPMACSEEKRINIIRELAKYNGWTETVRADGKGDPTLLIFRKGKEKVNVWFTTMTIATVIDHPTQGRNQLYKRGVNFRLLDKVFQEPRVHTGKGYRTT